MQIVNHAGESVGVYIYPSKIHIKCYGKLPLGKIILIENLGSKLRVITDSITNLFLLSNVKV